MGWKGNITTVRSLVRSVERDAKKKQRELEKKRDHYGKMKLLNQAAYQVEVYENQIKVIQSLHKDCSEAIDWQAVASSEPPKQPNNPKIREIEVNRKANLYKSSFIEKILKLDHKRQNELNESILIARIEDSRDYEVKLEEWESDVNDWQESIKLAELISKGDNESKLKIISELNPFAEISNLGSKVSFQIHDNSILEAEIHVHGKSIVPCEKKALLQSGKISVKKMPIGMYYDIYQDYVCSCALRVANELFSILPERIVIITAVDELLNTMSGHLEKSPILSAAIPRKTIQSLNMNHIDPSDAMNNFIHNMSFKKYKGFEAVEKVKPEDINH